MKKIIITFLLIIVFLFGFLTLLDLKGNYVAEKQLWEINKQLTEASKDPKIIPDATFNEIIKQYGAFVKRFPNSKLTPLAEILTARTLILKKDYPRALEALEKIIKKYNDKPEIAVQAAAELGSAYILKGDDSKVLQTYQRIQSDYPLTDLGLRTPILIAQFHSQRKEPILVQKAYEDAILYYKQLAAANRDSLTEFNALRLLAGSYLAVNKWQDAVTTLGEVLIRYSKPGYTNVSRAQNMIMSINTISITRLKNYDLPIKIYQDFIIKNPNHPFNSEMQKLLDSVKLLKKKNINLIMDKKL